VVVLCSCGGVVAGVDRSVEFVIGSAIRSSGKNHAVSRAVFIQSDALGSDAPVTYSGARYNQTPTSAATHAVACSNIEAVSACSTSSPYRLAPARCLSDPPTIHYSWCRRRRLLLHAAST